MDAKRSPMGTVHIPEDLDEQLDEYAMETGHDRPTAVGKLLRKGLESWRTERAIRRLRDGEVTFSRAAEMADLNVWALADLLREHDARWISGDHVELDLADRR